MNDRYSPYKNLPVSHTSSDNNLDSRTNTYQTTTLSDSKGAKGIKNQLVGGLPSVPKDKGLADMGREVTEHNTIFGEGPIYESKRIL